MKKFIIILVITLVLAGGAFYLGWIPSNIPVDSLAVVHTKTSGFRDNPIVPAQGGFIWFWENILPTNMKVYVFPDQEIRESLILQGTLPSGEVYGQFVGSANTFNYQIELEFEMRLDPNSIVALVRDKGWRPETMEEQLEGIFQEFTDTLAWDLRNQYVDESLVLDVVVGGKDYAQRVMDLFLENYPYFKDLTVRTKRFSFPDIGLYLTTRELFLAQLAQRQETEDFWRTEQWTLDLRENTRIQWLEKYGELFEKYPNLIEFFAIGLSGERMDALLPDLTGFQE